MNIFVFGGTGYLGSAAVRALAGDGHDVQVLVRSDVSKVKADALGAETVVGDLAEPSGYEAALGATDAVVFAASGQGEAWEEADRAAMDVITKQLGGTDKPLVRVLGSMVYGDTGAEPKPEDAPLNPPPFLQPAAEVEDRLLELEGVRTAFVHPLFTGAVAATSPASSSARLEIAARRSTSATARTPGTRCTWTIPGGSSLR